MVSEDKGRFSGEIPSFSTSQLFKSILLLPVSILILILVFSLVYIAVEYPATRSVFITAIVTAVITRWWVKKKRY